MYPYNYNPKNEATKLPYAFQKSAFKIYRDSIWDKTLFAYDIPLNHIITSFEEINIFKHREQLEDEFFLVVGSHYYYVKVTPEFLAWYHSGPTRYENSLELIKQFNDSLDCYLFKIAGGIWDLWLDYKTGKEVREFFKIN